MALDRLREEQCHWIAQAVLEVVPQKLWSFLLNIAMACLYFSMTMRAVMR